MEEILDGLFKSWSETLDRRKVKFYKNQGKIAKNSEIFIIFTLYPKEKKLCVKCINFHFNCICSFGSPDIIFETSYSMI